MDSYRFTAKAPSGKKVKGNLKVDNLDELKQIMIEHNFQLLNYRKTKIVKKSLFNKNVSKKDLLLFCENIYLMIKAGISLKEAIIFCGESTNNHYFKNIIISISKEMEKGKPFSVILNSYQNVFSTHFVTMMQIGDYSGNIKGVLEHLINNYKFEIRLNKKITSSMFYPMILLILSIVILFVVSIVIIPTFVKVFEQMKVDLPLITKILILISSFISNYYPFILMILLILICAVLLFFKTEKGSFFKDKMKVTLPIFKNIYLLVVASKFCRCLKILISSGVSTVTSLQTSSNLIGNKYIKEKFQFAIDEVKRGADISKALYSLDLFPNILIETLKISEQTASLDYSLQVLADLFEEDEQNKLQRLTTMIEPFFILVIAFIVIILVVSIFIPLFSMLDNIGGF